LRQTRIRLNKTANKTEIKLAHRVEARSRPKSERLRKRRADLLETR
jgi:hypothetical protein